MIVSLFCIFLWITSVQFALAWFMSSQSILQVMWHVCVVKYFSTQLLFPDVFSVTVHLCCFCSAVPLLQSGLISTPANTWYMHILLVHLHMNLNSASVSWTVRVLICSPHERQKNWSQVSALTATATDSDLSSNLPQFNECLFSAHQNIDGIIMQEIRLEAAPRVLIQWCQAWPSSGHLHGSQL